MPRPMSFVPVCRPKGMISYHINVVPQSVLSKWEDVMKSPTSFNRVLTEGEIVYHA